MKWRQTFIYLLVLVLVGGYFYYFEVVKEDQREEAERAARRVFPSEKNKIQGLELSARGKSTILLAKEPDWQITQPIKCEVDDTILRGLLHAIEDLEMVRELPNSEDEIKRYGLEEPALRIRFRAGEQWQELLIGDPNPAGTAYYAKVPQRPSVFLISQGDWSVLNKDVSDLRRKQLFHFEPLNVVRLEITWSSHDSFVVERSNGGSWKAPEHPDMKIKKSKVDNVLDQIQWLRAVDFVRDQSERLSEYGLAPPQAKIMLKLRDDQELTLLLGKPDEQKKMPANSSQLAGIVHVSAHLLDELPADITHLEDHSLIDLGNQQVSRIVWRLNDGPHEVVQTEPTRWKWKSSQGDLQELREGWPVKSLFWELENAEYTRSVSPAPDLPESVNLVELWSGENRLGSLRWPQRSGEKVQEIEVWRSEGAGQDVRALEVKAEVMQKIAEKLRGIEKQKTR